MDPDAWVPLAEIARPHGVRGELRLRLFNKTSDTLLGQDEVLVRLADGEEHEVSVERARRADDAILMKLYSVDDRDRAEELRGALVCVRRRDFEDADPGEFYAIDVVGAAVKLAGEPMRIGTVAEIITYPSVEVMLVHADDGKGDWEVPLTEMYIARVDVEAQLVELVSLDEIERVPRRKPKEPKPAKEPKASPPKSGAGEA
jgi:16S rRNA processing protein RimM